MRALHARLPSAFVIGIIVLAAVPVFRLATTLFLVHVDLVHGDLLHVLALHVDAEFRSRRKMSWSTWHCRQPRLPEVSLPPTGTTVG